MKESEIITPSHIPPSHTTQRKRVMQEFQPSLPGLTGRIFSTPPEIGPAFAAHRVHGYSPLTQQAQVLAPVKCPRCDSANTKFCYYNNYNLSQPRHFCKSCRRYWTKGGVLRNVPIGGGCRKSSKRSKPKPDKNRRSKNSSGSSSESSSFNPEPNPNKNANPTLPDAGLVPVVDPGPLPGFRIADPDPMGGLAGLEWSGAAVDPTSALFDLAGPVDPGLYWCDADPASLYLP